MSDEIIDADVVEESPDLQAAFDQTEEDKITQLPPPAEGTQVENGPAVQAITTEAAFVVYMLPDGRWVANSEAINTPIAVARQANFADMVAAAAVITKDIYVTETAQATVLHQRQAAVQLSQQMQAQKMFEEVQGAGMGVAGADLSKLVAQNRQQRRNR